MLATFAGEKVTRGWPALKGINQSQSRLSWGTHTGELIWQVPSINLTRIAKPLLIFFPSIYFNTSNVNRNNRRSYFVPRKKICYKMSKHWRNSRRNIIMYLLFCKLIKLHPSFLQNVNEICMTIWKWKCTYFMAIKLKKSNTSHEICFSTFAHMLHKAKNYHIRIIHIANILYYWCESVWKCFPKIRSYIRRPRNFLMYPGVRITFNIPIHSQQVG